MSQKTYLQLDYKSGTLFEYSADPKEGFEKHVSKTGKESYRKYHKYGAEGTLNNVSVRDSNFGKQISIALEDGIYVNFGLNDQKGNIDQFAEQIIKVLPMVNKGDQIKITPYNFLPEGEKYNKSGISFVVNGEKTKGLTNSYYDKEGKLVAGDVPAVKWKKDALGTNKPSAASLEEKNDYLTGVLAKEAERLKWVGSGNSNESVPQPKESKSYDPPAYEPDDLPF